MVSEARPIGLPLQPRNIDSRISAFPPCERNDVQLPFDTVIAAAAQGLSQTQRKMPEEKRLSLIGIHSMSVTSGNSIRTDHFLANFPSVGFHRIEGVEAHTGDVLEDAKSKAITATDAYLAHRRTLKSFVRRLKREEEFYRINPFNGPDALNAIPQAKPDGSFDKFVRVGKPERETPGREDEAIRERFASLAKMAQENNWPSIPYIVEQGTYIHNTKRKDDKYDAHSVRQSVILLNPAGLAFLATPEGFALYKNTALESDPLLVKTAGGMKIEAFKKLGIIQASTHDPKELITMQFTSDQQAEYERAESLALGILDIDLIKEYKSKFPPTLRERWAARKS